MHKRFSGSVGKLPSSVLRANQPPKELPWLGHQHGMVLGRTVPPGALEQSVKLRSEPPGLQQQPNTAAERAYADQENGSPEASQGKTVPQQPETIGRRAKQFQTWHAQSSRSSVGIGSRPAQPPILQCSQKTVPSCLGMAL